jgi:hypothetical protein
MRRFIPCFCLLLAAILILPAASSGQQKNKQKKDTVNREDATEQDYTNLAQIKEINGKIAAVDITEGTMTFTIEWSSMEPNVNSKSLAKSNTKAAQLQQQLLRDYYNAMSDKNPIHRQQALMRFQQHMQQLQAAGNASLQNMFKVVKSSKDFAVPVMDKVKVARLEPEQKYTDEGEVVKYTAAELKKMKSKDMPEGYTAAETDLKVGQSVKLFISPPKKQPAKKADAKSGYDSGKKADSSSSSDTGKKADSSSSSDTGKKADSSSSSDTGKKADSSSGSDTAKKAASSSDADGAKKADSSSGSDPTGLEDRPRVRMVLIIEEASLPDPPDPAPKKKKKDG